MDCDCEHATPFSKPQFPHRKNVEIDGAYFIDTMLDMLDRTNKLLRTVSGTELMLNPWLDVVRAIRALRSEH